MEKTNGGNLIQIKNLVATVNLNNGDTLVTVNKANMELKRGNSYAIVGKSGSGKTSLISIIGLLNHSYQGEFLYNGMSVSTLSSSQSFKPIVGLSPLRRCLFLSMSCSESLRLSA